MEKSIGEAKKIGKNENPFVPIGAWVQCPKCKGSIFKEELEDSSLCCPKCNHHFPMKAQDRIKSIVDQNSFQPFQDDIQEKNVLHFPEYEEKIRKVQESTGLKDAIITGVASIDEQEIVLAVMDNRFMMASMGQVVGEKLTLAVERATERNIPIVIFTTSGGARMQEGIVSLMQMAKVSGALKRHSKKGLLYITVLTHPTTGGVTASFAMLGDIILAEPDALVGFAGPRVIEQTMNQKLPEGFQRSEFLQEKGFVDLVVKRTELRNTLSTCLALHRISSRIKDKQVAFYNETEQDKKRGLKSKLGSRQNLIKQVSAWKHVELARASNRPTARNYINEIFEGFIELHGDRNFADDGAIIGGIASFHGQPVTIIGQQKGRSIKENMRCNFGMSNPEGYRKALRLMQQADKFNRPIICFVDTPGAYCGMGAEERGQGHAIATNLFEMADIKVPILSIIIGEGGSGGALALAVANEVWMLENSIYSVLSPEGFATILWKDSKRSKEAASVMKITAKELYEMGIIESVIPEPAEGIAEEFLAVTHVIEENIEEFFMRYKTMKSEEIVNQRYEKYRRMY